MWKRTRNKKIYILVPALCIESCVSLGRSHNSPDHIFIILKIKVIRSPLSVLWFNELFLWFHRNAKKDSEHFFSWKWQQVQSQRCGLACLGLWPDNGNKWQWEVWGYSHKAVLPPALPLEALQLAYLCKRFGSSFLFKSISDSAQSPEEQIHRSAENSHMLSWKEERREEPESLDGLVSGLGLPKKMSLLMYD